MPAAPARWRGAVAYILMAALGLVLAVAAMKVWRGDLRVPFTYSGDGLFTGALIKGAIQNGWMQVNPLLGLPGELNMGDFPLPEALLFGIIKVISVAAREWALTMNIFFLMTFPATAVLSLWVLRRLGVSWIPAAVVSLLYTALPYHFLRGEAHLFLSAYFLVPPSVLVVLWSMDDVPLLFSRDDATSWRLDLKRAEPVIALAVCALVGLSGIYYAFFTCFFLFVAGAITAARRALWQPFVSAMILASLVVVMTLVGLSPSIAYQRANGANPEAIERTQIGAEIYALKLDQVVLLPGRLGIAFGNSRT